MIRKTVQKKNSKTSLSQIEDIKLSIQINLDGFSFCISDLHSDKKLYFTTYSFTELHNSPEDLLNTIKLIFKNDTNLQYEFSKVQAIHCNNLNTIVPLDYFDENSLSSYLKFNIKTLKNDFITFDEMSQLKANNVYIPFVNINNYLFQNFGEFEYNHHTTILIEKLRLLESSEKTMFVNVFKNNFDIVILENKQLILSNSFNYTTKEDFIYYILFTAEQMQLNTEEFNLQFLGDIDSNSELYKIVYTYIKNISFIKNENPICYDLDLPNHSNYLLLS